MSSKDDIRSDVRDFLVSRRAKITPGQAGLPAGSNRRVPGLRRSEVAMLADVSVEYYSRLERGNVTGVSESVVGSIARALRLDEAERSHLADLVRLSSGGRRPNRKPSRQRIRPTVQRLLDTMTGAAAFVQNSRLELIALNDLARAVYAPVLAMGGTLPNNARYTFLDRGAQNYFRDWDKVASDCVAMLRAAAGRDPHDRALTDLIGELATRSDEFRIRWASHDVRIHTSGTKKIHHPLVGDIDLDFESLPLPGDPDQTLVVYTVEPASPSQDALNLLASWTATNGATTAHGTSPAT